MVSDGGVVNLRRGHLVRVNDGVRYWGGKQGVVASVREGEIGLDFGSVGAHGVVKPDAWFRPSELTPVIAKTVRPLRTPGKGSPVALEGPQMPSGTPSRVGPSQTLLGRMP